MKRDVFLQRFVDTANSVREFAGQFLEETLPREHLFHVELNSSYDGHAGPDFELFPEDSSPEVAARLKHLSAHDAVDSLWRNGKVPQWVNMSVVGETGSSTLIQVVACGRFTDDEDCLYHQKQGRPPFQTCGPTLPINYVEGQRFSIYSRSSCWTREDLDRAADNADKVWSLELYGAAFDDAAASQLRRFSSLEILETHQTRLAGSGLTALAGMPRLRVLRITCGDITELNLGPAPVHESVDVLCLSNLPARLLNVASIQRSFPRLSELRLQAHHSVDSNSELRVRGLDHLMLSFPTLPGWVQSAPDVKWITLHLIDATDREVERLLASAGDALTEVGLRGTPVSDAILKVLIRLPELTYLDAVNTRVTRQGLTDLITAHPRLKTWPKLGPSARGGPTTGCS